MKTGSVLALLAVVVLAGGCAGGGSEAQIDVSPEDQLEAEDSSSACQDSEDNDLDGATDCADEDCMGFVFCAPGQESTPGACGDDKDNDDDGKIDCDDTDCAGLGPCVADPEDDSEECADGSDNDGDSLADCDDSGCAGFRFCAPPPPLTEGTPALCQDDADNDGDQLLDCDDPDCQPFIACLPKPVPAEDTAALCQDQETNDEDELVDCEDPDCQGFVFCLPPDSPQEATAAQCKDDGDNDGDELVDCQDPDCQAFIFCQADQELTADACLDAEDNDGDQLTDCDDPDCQGYVFCLPPEVPTELTATNCQDGADNDGDAAADCDDPDCAGFVFCADMVEDSALACKDGKDNDGDQLTDCGDSDCWLWYFCGVYNGFPVADPWGSVFDGLERGKANLSTARETCEKLGARLPTAHELFRNNATSGTGAIGTVTSSEFLWTPLPSATDGQYIQVRLSDGAIQKATADKLNAFRCVWPLKQPPGFAGARCFGPPGDPCYLHDRVWNVDRTDRMALDWVAASAECSVHGAGLPLVGEWTEMLQSGLPGGTNAYNWTGNLVYWHSGGTGSTLVKWTGVAPTYWMPNYSDTYSLDWHVNPHAFRCMGLAQPDAFQKPPQQGCSGDCFKMFQGRRSPVVADGADRDKASVIQASEICRQLGAHLPNSTEFFDLLHAGWTAGSAAWMWTSSTLYWDFGGYGFNIMKWKDAGSLFASASWANSYYASAPAGPQAYRCIWRTADLSVPACPPKQRVVWDGAKFACDDAEGGSSSGSAYGMEAVDVWGDAWDGVQRPVATWSEAAAKCSSLGGRLPLPSELYRNNAATPLGGPGLGSPIDTSWLWTSIRPFKADTHVVVRISDGAASTQTDATPQAYRCVWPYGEADVLSGRNCVGKPGSACFTLPDGTIIDASDRPPMDFAAATAECVEAGGHLPDGRQLLRAITSGAPNGSDTWLWLTDVAYAYATTYGMMVLRWKDTGTPAWGGGQAQEAYAAGTAPQRFRCIYEPFLQ